MILLVEIFFRELRLEWGAITATGVSGTPWPPPVTRQRSAVRERVERNRQPRLEFSRTGTTMQPSGDVDRRTRRRRPYKAVSRNLETFYSFQYSHAVFPVKYPNSVYICARNCTALFPVRRLYLITTGKTGERRREEIKTGLLTKLSRLYNVIWAAEKPRRRRHRRPPMVIQMTVNFPPSICGPYQPLSAGLLVDIKCKFNGFRNLICPLLQEQRFLSTVLFSIPDDFIAVAGCLSDNENKSIFKSMLSITRFVHTIFHRFLKWNNFSRLVLRKISLSINLSESLVWKKKALDKMRFIFYLWYI